MKHDVDFDFRLNHYPVMWHNVMFSDSSRRTRVVFVVSEINRPVISR